MSEQTSSNDFSPDLITLDRLLYQVKEYAAGRSSDVARGAETPRLAGLLLQKYGLGMAAAANTLCYKTSVASAIVRLLDEETSKIDPLWKEHNKERWAGRPADVVSVE